VENLAGLTCATFPAGWQAPPPQPIHLHRSTPLSRVDPDSQTGSTALNRIFHFVKYSG
jgi:hypothetical protein